MKKLIFSLALALATTLTVNAQNNGQRPDPAKMAQFRTEQMVKRYGLNQQQAEQLLQLNTEYAGKIGPQGGRPGVHPRRGQRPAPADSVRPQRHPRPDRQPADSTRQHRPQRQAPQLSPEMQAYDEALQKILTEEQYKQYKSDAQRRNRGPRGGQRPQRPRN